MAFEEQFPQWIANLGFPIAMTIWFMVRTETVIKANTTALERIGVIINDCTKKKP
jgi:hypothetical protein